MDITELPEELLDHIASFASLETLKNLSRTNKCMFVITERQISKKCVINPNRREKEKHLLDLEDLQRTYFNVKLEEPPITPLTTSRILPKNVYLMKVDESTIGFVNDNVIVDKVFIHYNVNEYSREADYRLPLFAREVYCQAFSVKIKRVQKIDALISWISKFKTLTNIELIRCRVECENFVFPQKRYGFRNIIIEEAESGKFIQHLVNNSPDLSSLTLVRCKIEDSLSLLMLKELHITETEKVNLQNLLSSAVNNLEKLSLKKVFISKMDLLFLCQNTKLSRLALESCDTEKRYCPDDLSCVGDIASVKLEGDLLEKCWPHLKNVEVLELELNHSLELQEIELPRLRHLIISGEASKKPLKNLTAKNLKHCSVSEFIDWMPQCSVVSLNDNIDNENESLEQLINALKNQKLGVSRVFFKCLELDLKNFNILLNCELQNTELLVDFSEYFQSTPQTFEDVLKLVKTVGNLNLTEENDGNGFVIFKENNLKIVFVEKPVDRANARGIFAHWQADADYY